MKKKIIIILISLVAILLIAIYIAFSYFKIEDIVVEGLENQTEDVVIDKIFEDNKDRSSLLQLLHNRFGKKASIPFVEDYDFVYESKSKVKITVYEKKIVGRISLMNQNWYFDKDGIVVESSEREIKGVVLVTGLDFDYIVVEERIPLENQVIFERLMNLAQLIRKYNINVSRINIDSSNSIKLYISNVRIALGNDDKVNEKMLDLRDMLPTLANISGELDMKEYDASRKGYIFRKD